MLNTQVQLGLCNTGPLSTLMKFVLKLNQHKLTKITFTKSFNRKHHKQKQHHLRLKDILTDQWREQAK